MNIMTRPSMKIILALAVLMPLAPAAHASALDKFVPAALSLRGMLHSQSPVSPAIQDQYGRSLQGILKSAKCEDKGTQLDCSAATADQITDAQGSLDELSAQWKDELRKANDRLQALNQVAQNLAALQASISHAPQEARNAIFPKYFALLKSIPCTQQNGTAIDCSKATMEIDATKDAVAGLNQSLKDALKGVAAEQVNAQKLADKLAQLQGAIMASPADVHDPLVPRFVELMQMIPCTGTGAAINCSKAILSFSSASEAVDNLAKQFRDRAQWVADQQASGQKLAARLASLHVALGAAPANAQGSLQQSYAALLQSIPCTGLDRALDCTKAQDFQMANRDVDGVIQALTDALQKAAAEAVTAATLATKLAMLHDAIFGMPMGPARTRLQNEFGGLLNTLRCAPIRTGYDCSQLSVDKVAQGLESATTLFQALGQASVDAAAALAAAQKLGSRLESLREGIAAVVSDAMRGDLNGKFIAIVNAAQCRPAAPSFDCSKGTPDQVASAQSQADALAKLISQDALQAQANLAAGASLAAKLGQAYNMIGARPGNTPAFALAQDYYAEQIRIVQNDAGCSSSRSSFDCSKGNPSEFAGAIKTAGTLITELEGGDWSAKADAGTRQELAGAILTSWNAATGAPKQLRGGLLTNVANILSIIGCSFSGSGIDCSHANLTLYGWAIDNLGRINASAGSH